MAQEFSEADRVKMLLWCDRHCCLCGKACATKIEIAHIDPEGPGEIDNAIPLCFDCHAEIGHYNPEHPRGNRYRETELKTRREQVYERHTRMLVPPVSYEITQDVDPGTKRSLPNVGFNILHLGDSLPVRALIGVTILLDGQDAGPPASDLYSRREAWNLNPRFGFGGHFNIPKHAAESDGRLQIAVDVSVIDQYKRQHDLLPVSWIYMRDRNSWFAHPLPN